MKYCSYFLFPILLLFSCGGGAETDTNTEETNTPSESAISQAKTTPTKLLVGLDYLRLRSTPGEKGEEIAYLKKGTILYETGDVSDFSTRIKLRGIWFDEPWIKVKTDKGIEGWVYGGAVTFDMQNPTAISNKLLDLRLKSFFGNSLSQDLHSYRKAYHSANTSQDFSDLFKNGEQLRDTMVTILEDKINVMDMDYDHQPDLFWVEEALPGYRTALVAEGTIYYLFQDFKAFQKVARKTTGTEDDDFVNLNLKVHASDSIEYFFPAWYIQTWDYGGHSLLGQGKHLDILTEADNTLKKSNLFIEEVIKIKDRLIDDISGNDVSYWEPLEKIIKELDNILASDLGILTRDDKIALETRRKMFDDPKANKIEVNHKTGMQ